MASSKLTGVPGVAISVWQCDALVSVYCVYIVYIVYVVYSMYCSCSCKTLSSSKNNWYNLAG